MSNVLDHRAMLQVALAEARQGLSEGGVPLGAALYRNDGTLLGRGHHRRVQLMTDSIAASPELWHEDIGEG